MKIKNLGSKVSALVLVIWPLSSAAQIMVDTELSLVVDVSGSISSIEYATQIEGYEEAFRDPSIQQIVSQGRLGTIAVNMVFFGSVGVEVIPFQTISNSAEATAFANAVELLIANENALRAQASNGGTDIAEGLKEGARTIVENNYEGRKKVIDVSGDGSSDILALQTVKNDIADDIDVINGLPIALPSSTLISFYEDYVIMGEGAFVERASEFSDFERAVKFKIKTELARQIECSNPLIYRDGTWMGAVQFDLGCDTTLPYHAEYSFNGQTWYPIEQAGFSGIYISASTGLPFVHFTPSVFDPFNPQLDKILVRLVEDGVPALPLVVQKKTLEAGKFNVLGISALGDVISSDSVKTFTSLFGQIYLENPDGFGVETGKEYTIEFVSGTLAGVSTEATAFSSTSIAVNISGASIEAGDVYVIREAVTLESAFQEQLGLINRASPFYSVDLDAVDQFMIQRADGSFDSYYFQRGNGGELDELKKSDGSPLGSTVIMDTEVVLIKRAALTNPNPVTLTFVGSMKVGPTLITLLPGYNYVAHAQGVDLTLEQSGLSETVVEGGVSGVTGDRLFFPINGYYSSGAPFSEFNIYHYADYSFFGLYDVKGWIEADDTSTTIDANLVPVPSGFLINRGSTAAGNILIKSVFR